MFEFAALYTFAKKNNSDFYFQDPKWFSKYAEDIKALFGKDIGYLEQVAIHVRRGDYVGNKFYSQLWDTDYYDKAMALFPGENFLIFSDDPEWCRTKFKGDNIQVMEMQSEVEDLNLMASCKAQIIANSSYSWWAGFLNPNPAKKVVYPLHWYADGVERTVCPNTWIPL